LKKQSKIDILKKMVEEPQKMVCPARKWTKRAGIIAFLFFLGKGLLWIGVAVGTYYTVAN